MYRSSIIFALSAAATVQAAPLNVDSRPNNDFVIDAGVVATVAGEDSASGMKNAIRSEENFNKDDKQLNNSLDITGFELFVGSIVTRAGPIL